MKRNDDLLRELLLRVEERDGQSYDFEVEGHSKDEVNYHLALLVESDYLRGNVLRTGTLEPGSSGIMDVHVDQLTMEGHDFLDAVRSDDVWDATKKKVAATVGTTSLVVMKEIATAYVREKLGLD